MIGTAKAPSARSIPAMFTELRVRFGIAAALLAVIALALPAFASADPFGTVTFYKTGLQANPALYNVTAGPDGNVWFADEGVLGGKSGIGRIKASGETFEINEYLSGENLSGLNGGSEPVAIATGPDGKLWFTDKGPTPAIGVIDPASPETATEFSIEEKGGNPGAVPQGIVAGPGGNLWFADNGTIPAIGKIDPITHAVEEFPIDEAHGGNEGSQPHGIVAGPDGKLWFTDNGTTPAIGRIDPTTHAVEEFGTGAGSIPGGTFGGALGPWGIAVGPDGNVWFTENGFNSTEGRSATGKAIGRLVPSGTKAEIEASLTYFSTNLVASSQPWGLTAANGELWFTDASGVSEQQQLTIEASSGLGGTYKLGFEGDETGWTGEATLAGETGTGDPVRATGGKGTYAKESTTITITTAPTSANKFAVNQLITSTGLKSGTTITACSTTCNEVGSTLTISQESAEAKTAQALTAGNVTSASGGPFVVGHSIEGTGIGVGATITAIEGSTLILSAVPSTAGTGITLNAGIKAITGYTTSTGKLSNLEQISGTGIQAGTTVSAVNEGEGKFTLSKVPTSGGTVSLAADLPFSASGSTIATALSLLPSAGGGGNLLVSGSGSTSPVTRTVTFEGPFRQTDVELISCNGSGLTGTSPTCGVATTEAAVTGAVGSITTSGTIARYPVEDLTDPAGITSGPGGNVWFADTGSRQLGAFGIGDNYPLTVTKTGTGSGTVQCDTGSGPEACEAEYFEGTAVELTATAGSGSEFTGWTGSGCSGTGTCEVTMCAAKSVEANFDLIPRTLTINPNPGTGTGSVECKFGVGSFGACTSPQPNGTAVEVKATANAGSELAASTRHRLGRSCSASPVQLHDRSQQLGDGDIQPQTGPHQPRHPDGRKVRQRPGRHRHRLLQAEGDQVRDDLRKGRRLDV